MDENTNNPNNSDLQASTPTHTDMSGTTQDPMPTSTPLNTDPSPVNPPVEPAAQPMNDFSSNNSTNTNETLSQSDYSSTTDPGFSSTPDFAPPPTSVDSTNMAGTNQSNFTAPSTPSVSENTMPMEKTVPDFMNVQNESTPNMPNMSDQTAPPPTANSVPPMTPKSTNKMVYVVLGIVILALLAVVGYMVVSSGNTTPQNSPTPQLQQTLQPLPTMTSTPIPTEDPTTGWESHTTSTYSYRYPSEATFHEDEEGFSSLSYWGPTQTEGTELFDGYAVTFTPKELPDADPLDYAQDHLDESLDAGIGETTSPVESITVNGYSGATYSFSGLGDYTYYFLKSTDGNMLIEISVINPDPGNLGFEETVNQILSSFEFTGSSDAMMMEGN